MSASDCAAECLQPILKRFLAEGLVSLPAVVYLQPAPPPKGSREEPSARAPQAPPRDRA